MPTKKWTDATERLVYVFWDYALKEAQLDAVWTGSAPRYGRDLNLERDCCPPEFLEAKLLDLRQFGVPLKPGLGVTEHIADCFKIVVCFCEGLAPVERFFFCKREKKGLKKGYCRAVVVAHVVDEERTCAIVLF